MIFASDLDQTLIYSINFLNKHYKNHDLLLKDSLSLIEYYNGKPLSYIHNDVIKKIKALDQKDLFVPVTTRTEEQYKRIEFSKFDITPEYAVTTNGAKVLKDGIVDLEWQELINHKLSQNVNNEYLLEVIKEIIPQHVIKKVRTAENIFSYCVLYRELFSEDLLHKLNMKLSACWSLSLQGTKLYFMPKPISKWEAVNYVCQKTGVSKVAAAGDSLLDITLLENADIGIIPTHGEIFNQQLQGKYGFSVTSRNGVEASISILDTVLK